MKSIWAQKRLDEMNQAVDKIQNGNRRGKIVLLVVLLVIWGGLMIALFTSRDNMGETFVPTAASVSILFVVILFLAIFAINKSKTLDLTKPFQDMMEKLLETESAEMLDQELLATPQGSFDCNSEETIWTTPSYVVLKKKTYGFYDYRIIRKGDISQLDYRTEGFGANKEYHYHLANMSDEIIMSFVVLGKKNAIEFEEFVENRIPGIGMPDHSLLS